MKNGSRIRGLGECFPCSTLQKGSAKEGCKMSYILGPELMFAKCDKRYPSRSGQTSRATAATNFTKPVTKYNSGPGIWLLMSARMGIGNGTYTHT